jgi:hypothetical protein
MLFYTEVIISMFNATNNTLYLSVWFSVEEQEFGLMTKYEINFS